MLQWYSAENLDPPDIDPTNYGWTSDNKMKIMKFIILLKEIDVDPKNVLSVI